MKPAVFLVIFLSMIFACRQEPKHKNAIYQQVTDRQVEKSHNARDSKRIDTLQKWVELRSLDSTFVLDMRYATTHNFVHKKMYPCPRCFVRPEVAKALLSIQKELKTKGLRIKLFDCYRPGKVQWRLWKIKPDPRFVADPRKGSMHNRGVAVDLTLVDASGKELDMGTPFDYFGKKAYHSYQKLPDTVLKNRLFLNNIMKKHGLEPITSEWWHYSYRKKNYPVEQWIWNCN